MALTSRSCSSITCEWQLSIWLIYQKCCHINLKDFPFYRQMVMKDFIENSSVKNVIVCDSLNQAHYIRVTR